MKETVRIENSRKLRIGSGLAVGGLLLSSACGLTSKTPDRPNISYNDGEPVKIMGLTMNYGQVDKKLATDVMCSGYDKPDHYGKFAKEIGNKKLQQYSFEESCNTQKYFKKHVQDPSEGDYLKIGGFVTFTRCYRSDTGVLDFMTYQDVKKIHNGDYGIDDNLVTYYRDRRVIDPALQVNGVSCIPTYPTSEYTALGLGPNPDMDIETGLPLKDVGTRK